MTTPRWLMSMALVVAALAPLSADAALCTAGEYVYRFVNKCAEPLWLGQRSTADTASHPAKLGGWTLASSCTANEQCPSRVCDRDSGQCTCKRAAECPGDAECLADGKCSTASLFCMPQDWSSGSFWPRTGCTLDDKKSPVELSCRTGACFDVKGAPLLDCSVSNGGGSPTNPVTQFEVTSTSSQVNYDVSIAAGYNVETKAIPVGGGQVVPGTPKTDVVACYDAGCTADLNAMCPAPLQVKDGTTVIGCLDPCTRCQRAGAPAELKCHTPLPDDWSCEGKSGKATYRDLYCAKNVVDGVPLSSANQGTPTAFGQRDCPPHTTFVRPTFTSAYHLPAGQGVCLYTNPPQSTTPHFNDFGWADAVTKTTRNCGGTPPHYDALPDGTACGGYRTTQPHGGHYADALGYTCREAKFPVHGGHEVTAHLCMPPTVSGLGTCVKDSLGKQPLYTATGGVANPAWLEAGKAAGGGRVPYYETFKEACVAAYAWQYDDIASGFGCTPTAKTEHGATFSGFEVVFCASRTLEAGLGGGARADRVVGLEASGRAGGIARPGKGRLRIRGRTTLPVEVPLTDTEIVITDLLDEVGASGELVAGGEWVLTAIGGGKAKKAVFATADGVEPRVRVVLRRPRADAEQVKVVVVASKATIARPAGCDHPAGEAKLETGLSISANGEETRVGTITGWRCGKKTLRGR